MDASDKCQILVSITHKVPLHKSIKVFLLDSVVWNSGDSCAIPYLFLLRYTDVYLTLWICLVCMLGVFLACMPTNIPNAMWTPWQVCVGTPQRKTHQHVPQRSSGGGPRFCLWHRKQVRLENRADIVQKTLHPLHCYLRVHCGSAAVYVGAHLFLFF